MEKLEDGIDGSLVFVDYNGKSLDREWCGKNDQAPNDFVEGVQRFLVIIELTQNRPVRLI